MSRVVISDKCIGCAACVDDCTRRAISLKSGTAVCNDEMCNDCFHCVAICPVNALSIEGYDADEIEEMRDNYIDPDVFLMFQKSRRSIRQYKSDEISPEILDSIFQAGRFSPTGGNMQTNHFIVVREGIDVLRSKVINTLYELALDDERLEKMHLSKYKKTWINMYNVFNYKGEDRLFFGAPYLVIIVNDDITGNGQVNGGIAASRMELLANTYGLGTCYIGFLKRALLIDPGLKEYIGIKEGEEYSLAFVMGYPDVKYLRTVCRKAVDVRYI